MQCRFLPLLYLVSTEIWTCCTACTHIFVSAFSFILYTFGTLFSMAWCSKSHKTLKQLSEINTGKRYDNFLQNDHCYLKYAVQCGSPLNFHPHCIYGCNNDGCAISQQLANTAQVTALHLISSRNLGRIIFALAYDQKSSKYILILYILPNCIIVWIICVYIKWHMLHRVFPNIVLTALKTIPPDIW